MGLTDQSVLTSNHFELEGFWTLQGKQQDLSMSLVMNEPLLSEEEVNRSSGALCWPFSVETRYPTHITSTKNQYIVVTVS